MKTEKITLKLLILPLFILLTNPMQSLSAAEGEEYVSEATLLRGLFTSINNTHIFYE